MKKHFILIVVLLLAAWGGKAQSTFAPLGAEWWYYSSDGFGANGIYMLLNARVSGDTVLDGTPCRVIEQTTITRTSTDRGTPWEPLPTLWTSPDTVARRSLYVYDNVDTVFIYNDLFQKFTPLYVFNVQEQDTVCLPVIPDVFGDAPLRENPYTGDTSFCIIIDSIRTVVYDTMPLRTIYSRSLFDIAQLHPDSLVYNSYPVMNWSFGSMQYSPGIYAEKIGGIHGGILPIWLYIIGQFDGYDVTNFIRLNCYGDLDAHIRLSDSACYYMPSPKVSIEPLFGHPEAISIYPNPTDGRITIETDNRLSDRDIEVRDIMGRKMATPLLVNSKDKLVLDTSKLSEGLYVLQITIKGVPYSRKISIRH